MITSIRRYLLIHLLLGFTAIIAIMTIASYYWDHKSIDHHLDHWLQRSTQHCQSTSPITADRNSIRQSLESQIATNTVYILIFSYPILGLLIWFIIGRGLNALSRVGKEVGDRATHYLEPFDLKSIPIEMLPLIDELNKLFLRLHQGLEREKAFSANAAHELRTPLAAIKTQAQVARKTNDETQRKTALRNLIASVDRCTHVVQQLLILSRLVPEATLQDVSKVDLSNLTAEVIAGLAPAAINKQIDIELIAASKKIYLAANATALSILIRNLVDNAIRYTPEHGIITVHLSQSIDQRHSTLRVSDNGPGISPELRSQVFERFYRVLGNQSSGSGLGLAIVQQIASLHNAKVILETPINGQGLDVIIHFPNHTTP